MVNVLQAWQNEYQLITKIFIIFQLGKLKYPVTFLVIKDLKNEIFPITLKICSILQDTFKCN
jgi:hypothetical protein